MKHVSFEEYEAAKAEIIGGVHYIEKSTMENDVIHKTYSTEENGTFYEVNDKGRVEFWSDKHSESRIYDENERATETDKKAGPGYGDLLAERIRANADASKLTDFEKFVLDRGYMFATEADLKAGYDRKWKANHGIESRVSRVEDGLFNNITGNPFLASFDSLDGITLVKGIWNEERKRIEC